MSERSPPRKPVAAESSVSLPLETSVELLRRAREGEDRALSLLIERYLPAFRAWASRRFPRYARDGQGEAASGLAGSIDR